MCVVRECVQERDTVPTVDGTVGVVLLPGGTEEDESALWWATCSLDLGCAWEATESL